MKMFGKHVLSVLIKRASLIPRQLDVTAIKPAVFLTSSRFNSTYSSVSQIFERIATVADETVVGQVNGVLQFNVTDDVVCTKYF